MNKHFLIGLAIAAAAALLTSQIILDAAQKEVVKTAAVYLAARAKFWRDVRIAILSIVVIAAGIVVIILAL